MLGFFALSFSKEGVIPLMIYTTLQILIGIGFNPNSNWFLLLLPPIHSHTNLPEYEGKGMTIRKLCILISSTYWIILATGLFLQETLSLLKMLPLAINLQTFERSDFLEVHANSYFFVKSYLI